MQKFNFLNFCEQKVYQILITSKITKIKRKKLKIKKITKSRGINSKMKNHSLNQLIKVSIAFTH